MNYIVMGLPSKIVGGTYVAKIGEDRIPHRLVAEVYGETSGLANELAGLFVLGANKDGELA